MKNVFFLPVCFLILFTFLPVRGQSLVRNSKVTGVCYAGNKVNKYYIPPPARFFRRAGIKNGGTITVHYSGFSSQAKTAMQFAVSVLQSLLPADTKFTIDATWERISGSGVLAQSTITGYAGGWGIDALNPLTLYPVALAEKISGESLNSDTVPDITLSVNSSINWYLGTDGQTPVQNYDLVTVVIHEICHGLGFFDSFGLDGTVGYYGVGSIPMVYDTFIEDASGNKLTDTLKYLNNSVSLGSQLTSSQIYFNGPLLKTYTTGSRAKLYAPSVWDPGSSVSHLDESATLRANSLMTPFIDLGEAIHDPGNFTFSILGDLGWINTRIIHKPVGDTEDHLSSLTLSADIQSDTTYDHNRVGVVYSFDDFLTIDTLYLTSPGTNDSYSASIDIPSYNTGLQYYFFAQDYFRRNYRSPAVYKDYSFIKNNRYHTYIGTDTVKPVITHTPVDYYLQTTDSIRFNADVTDNLGIDSVYVEFKINDGASRFVRLTKEHDNNYNTIFGAESLSLKGQDSIQYKIFAVDTAKVPNLGMLPRTGFFVTKIEEITTTLSSYNTDFSNAAPDFFNIGFDVSKPAGFSNSGLNTKHPYESPEDNNKSINYTAMLRHPLKLDESGLLFTFNEIVLVEPGDAGTVFGSPNFYDYVITEASKDFGKSWFKLTDGYDCRLFPSWETAYNSSISGNNSTFVGTESMLEKHSFLLHPSDNISAGDTLLVRFRLFSDPFANGWGWIIEDLKINPLVDAVPEVINHPVTIYPNPGHGLINIGIGLQGSFSYKPLYYSVYNSGGICLINKSSSGASGNVIDISNYPPGMYIIVLYLDDGIKTITYSLVK